MCNAPTTLLERLDAVRAATAAMDGFSSLAQQGQPADLGPILGELAELNAATAAQLAAVTAVAESTGVVQDSQCASTRAWVEDNAWHARAQAGTIARTAAVLRRPELTPVAAAVIDLDITPQVAVAIAEQFDKTRGFLTEGSDAEVLDWFVQTGAEQGTGQVKSLREHIFVRFGKPGSFQQEQDRRSNQVHLSAGRETADGVHQYELTIDPESRAQLEAAIGPMSSPTPGADGAPDSRSIGRRRGEALIDALRRSVSNAASGQPGGAKANVMVAIDLEDVRSRLGAGTVIGSRAQGTLLAPDTVRRLACDAAIIPVVLGSDSQIVDLGREVRLFDLAQTRAVWYRDRHCTFGNCTAPAAWCNVHHLWHWVDGGPTDLDNAALLCRRHHTIVHRDSLAGKLVGNTVVWDRTLDSYARFLTEIRRI